MKSEDFQLKGLMTPGLWSSQEIMTIFYVAYLPELVQGLYLQTPPLLVRTAGLFERSRGPDKTFDEKDLFSRVAPTIWNQF